MKNNIILILVVTVISIVIIVASVLLSTGNREEGEPSGGSAQTTASSAAVTTAPTQTEPVTVATTTTPAETTAAPVHDSETAEQIIATAQSLLGTDFADGGDTPEAGFDNSGFIYYVLRENGYITCPRGVSAQAEMGGRLSYEELKLGDLVFFYNEDFSGIGFGGIYCGDGKMTACLMPGTQVKEINIESEYYHTYFSHGVSIT